MIDLAIVIVNYNTKDITTDCLKSVFKHKSNRSYEVWVVDNASTDDSIKQIKKYFPEVKLIKSDKNLGFAGGNNLALKRLYKEARYTLLLNSDTVLYPRALDNLVDFAESKNFGIASCKLVSPDNSFQPNAGSLPGIVPAFFWLSGLDDLIKRFYPVSSYHQESKKFYSKDKSVGWVSGSVMLVRTDVFTKIGFLNDKIFMYGEDVDFCWRARKAGYQVGWTPSAKIMHIGGASSDQPKFKQWSGEFRGLLFLYKKNYGLFASLFLRLLIYLFVILRAVAFLLLGKTEHAKTYAQVVVNL